MVTATMLVDGVAGLTMQKSMHLSMVVSIVVEMVEQTAAVATVVAMAFEEHEGGHTGDGVVDGDGVAQWVTVTVGMVEEGGGKDGFNERLEEWGLSERIVGSRTNDRRAGLWPSGAQTSCFATAAAAGPAQAHACHTGSVHMVCSSRSRSARLQGASLCVRGSPGGLAASWKREEEVRRRREEQRSEW